MKTFIQILFSIFFLSACQTSQTIITKPHPAEIQHKSFEEDALGLKLTTQGNNREASFSPDGNKICFVSDSRFAHRNRQLYEFTLSSRIERRVSFSDGDIFLPIYSAAGDKILYASTTDEIKERPLLFYSHKYQYRIPKDLYATDSAALTIERILNSEGSQSDLHAIPGQHDQYTFVSSKEEQSQIVRLNLHTKTESTLKTFSQLEPTRPLLTKKNEIYWLQSDGTLLKSAANKENQIVKVPLKLIDLKWAIPEKDMMLVLGKNESQKYVIAILNEKQSCWAQLMNSERKITGVDYSAKGNKLLLVIEDEEKNHLFLKELRASDLEALACESIQQIILETLDLEFAPVHQQQGQKRHFHFADTEQEVFARPHPLLKSKSFVVRH